VPIRNGDYALDTECKLAYSLTGGVRL
jgi:hypothetical protein